MATTNIPVTGSWTPVASSAIDRFLLTTSDTIEVAVTGADGTAPTVTHGHEVARHLGVTRAVIGEGAVWARAPSGAAVVVVS